MDCATISSDVIGDFQEPYRAVLVDGHDIAALPSNRLQLLVATGAAQPARGPLQVSALQADAFGSSWPGTFSSYRSQAPTYLRMGTYAKKSGRSLPRCTGYLRSDRATCTPRRVLAIGRQSLLMSDLPPEGGQIADISGCSALCPGTDSCTAAARRAYDGGAALLACDSQISPQLRRSLIHEQPFQ